MSMRSTVWVRLEFVGTDADVAASFVERALDAGVLQDPINAATLVEHKQILIDSATVEAPKPKSTAKTRGLVLAIDKLLAAAESARIDLVVYDNSAEYDWHKLTIRMLERAIAFGKKKVR